MLQINNNASLVQCNYNLSLLFSSSGVESVYRVSKQNTSSIILRSPKNFNIGNQNVINLNFNTPDLTYSSTHNFFLNTLFISQTTLYNLLGNSINTTPVLGINSMRVSIKTNFSLKWLEI